MRLPIVAPVELTTVMTRNAGRVAAVVRLRKLADRTRASRIWGNMFGVLKAERAWLWTCSVDCMLGCWVVFRLAPLKLREGSLDQGHCSGRRELV